MGRCADSRGRPRPRDRCVRTLRRVASGEGPRGSSGDPTGIPPGRPLRQVPRSSRRESGRAGGWLLELRGSLRKGKPIQETPRRNDRPQSPVELGPGGSSTSLVSGRGESHVGSRVVARYRARVRPRGFGRNRPRPGGSPLASGEPPVPPLPAEGWLRGERAPLSPTGARPGSRRTAAEAASWPPRRRSGGSRYGPRVRRSRATTSRWISFVPSKISLIRASR